MRLHKRVIAMVMGLQILSIVLIGIATNDGIRRIFTISERFFFEQRMTRLQEAVNNVGTTLKETLDNWVSWSVLHNYIKRWDYDFFQTLVKDNTFGGQNVDFLVVANSNMEPVIAYFSDNSETRLFSEELTHQATELLAQVFIGFDHEQEQNDSPNFLKLGDEIYIFKAAPIKKSKDEEVLGVVLGGINLDKILREMATLLNFPCELLPNKEEKTISVPDSGEQEESLSNNNILINNLSDTEAIVQLQSVPVLGSDTSYVLSAVMPRELFGMSNQMVDSTYIWLCCNGITLTILMIDFLSKAILGRLTSLKQGVETIITDFDLSTRIEIAADDEIGDLTRSVNILLEAFEHVLMQIPEALILSNSDGNVLLLNDEARRLLHVQSFSRDRDRIFIKDIVKKDESKVFNSSNDLFSGEGTFLRVDDRKPVPVDLQENKLDFGPNVLTIFLAHDLTEHKKLMSRIKWNEQHDSYTGLPNRKSFVDTLTQLLGKSLNPFRETKLPPVTIVVINMDHFKSINAEVTNTGGDIILTITAERIENVLNDRGTLYRTGGDEFTILFTPDENGEIISTSDLEKMLTEMRTEIAMPCQMGDTRVYPSVSMGVLFNALQYRDPSLIMEKAMIALRDSKIAGLNRITVYQEREKEINVEFSQNVLRMRYEIQEGVKQKQFVPYFQPVYDIKTRRLSGFETLARWQHPERGFLTPYHFVKYAETIGLIGDIDQYMMQCAMKAVAESPAPYYFSANGSSNLMQKGHTNKLTELLLDNVGILEGQRGPDAASLILNMIESQRIDPSRFAVEVTESILIDNLESVKEILSQLRQHNIRIFLDDFGTGYSSLQYLHDLPFNVIKLDQSFVRRIFESEKDRNMLCTIIQLAEDLGMDTIAEGVETEQQLEWLAETGCKKAQGYFFAKPLPESEAKALIAKEYKLLLDSQNKNA